MKVKLLQQVSELRLRKIGGKKRAKMGAYC